MSTTLNTDNRARLLAAELRAHHRLQRDLAAATGQRIVVLRGALAVTEQRIVALGGSPTTAGPSSDNDAAAIAARILAAAGKGAKLKAKGRA